MNAQDFVSNVLPFFQLILATFNIIILIYGFNKFLNKPKDDINARITTLEGEIRDLKVSINTEIKEIKDSLHKGNDNFREQDKTNDVLIHSVLALIEFEMQYCLVEHKDMSDGLKQAKKDLNDFLSRR